MDVVAEFNVAISSTVDVLHRTVEEIMKSVRALPYSTSDLDDIKLAVTEALANAIIHGNRQDPNKSVRICVRSEGSGDVLFAITDEGDGFNRDLVPDPRTGENVFSNHGRGLFLINYVMDSAEFRLGGRQLIMRKRAQVPFDKSTGSQA